MVFDTLPEDPKPDEFGKQNWAWYAGVAIGQAKKKGDFAVEFDFQWARAQAVPDYDFSGIGRGNTAGAGLYSENINGSAKDKEKKPKRTTAKNAVGPCNYRGWELDFLYLLTNNLSVDINFKMSWTLDKRLGGNRRYTGDS